MSLLEFAKIFVMEGEDEVSVRIIGYSVENGKYTIGGTEDQEYEQYLHRLGCKDAVGEVVLFAKSIKEILVFTGLGSQKVEEYLRRNNSKTAGAAAIKKVKNIKQGYITFGIECYDLILGAVLGSYEYNFFKSEQEPKFFKFSVKSEKGANAIKMGNAQNFARFLGDTPANHCYPRMFLQYAMEYLKDKGVKISTHDKLEMEEKKMKLLLSVSQGSDNEPILIHAKYKGATYDEVDISLVGKGVTFDSGGISLKPANNMAAMKGDMLGAASVLSVMGLVADMKLPVNVDLIIPLVENLPSGKATKPGDVFIGMNKKSVEVDNTDAEGRLILADALTFAQERSPRYIIDVATLTGAMSIALGDAYIGYFCNGDEFAELIDKSAIETNDLVWRLPLSKLYFDQIKSSVADLKNIGGRKAGSATAALFLSEFINFGTKWAHFDIAGVMNDHGNATLYGTGMTGIGVPTLFEVVNALANK